MPKLTDWLKERAYRDEGAPDPKPLQHAWYQVGGATVHLDGRNLPHPCARCRAPSEFACDYPVTEGVTCSAPICGSHAKKIGPNRHLCPLHVKLAERRTGTLL